MTRSKFEIGDFIFKIDELLKYNNSLVQAIINVCEKDIHNHMGWSLLKQNTMWLSPWEENLKKIQPVTKLYSNILSETIRSQEYVVRRKQFTNGKFTKGSIYSHIVQYIYLQ